MRDLKLDFHNKTILNEYIDKKNRVIQQIKVAVRTWQGDFFLNTDFGVPYTECWSNTLLMQTSLKDVVSQISGVSNIANCKVNKIKKYDRDFYEAYIVIIYDNEEITIREILEDL